MEKYEEIIPMLDSIIKRVTQKYDVMEIVLFGSYAWGKPTEESDVDLAIVLNGLNKPESYLERIKRNSKITSFIKEIRIEKPVDFIIYSSEEWQLLLTEKSELINEIENAGVKFYEKAN